MGIENFEKLPCEKQTEIINAAIEVFGRNEYKKASTEEISRRAGISKGMLFYYFKDKKSLYIYALDYINNLVSRRVLDEKFQSLDDFFDILSYSADKKVQLWRQHPEYPEFVLRAYGSKNEEISRTVAGQVKQAYENLPGYFANIRLDKFKDGVDIAMVSKMLLWMVEGYIADAGRCGRGTGAQDIMQVFSRAMNLIKSAVYKPEFIGGKNEQN